MTRLSQLPLAARLLTILTAVLAVIGGTVLVIDSDGPGPGKPITVTIPRAAVTTTAHVTAADGTPTTLSAPAPVVAAAAPKLEQNLGVENPTAVNVAAQDQQAALDDLPVTVPDAAPSQRGCTTREIRVNYSSRRGLAPRVFFLHETVSRDVRGWADVNAIGALFGRPATAASSHLVLDREGHCLLLLSYLKKAWTQASANPWGISVEIINPANNTAPNLIDGPGRRKLLGIINDVSKSFDIPIRRARLTNCTPTRTGITDHMSLGPCGGGHVDVSPFRKSVDAIIVAARRLCVTRYRTAGHPVPRRCKAA